MQANCGFGFDDEIEICKVKSSNRKKRDLCWRDMGLMKSALPVGSFLRRLLKEDKTGCWV